MISEQQMDFLELETLAPFSRSFQRMSVQQQIDLAKEFLSNCQEFDRILVIETGVSPLVQIMQEILKRRHESKEFYFLKIPRECDVDQYVESHCFRDLKKFVEKPFLVLDEYIDSGHTINMVISVLRKLGSREHFRLMAYMNFCSDPEIKSILHFACADHPC